MSFVITARTILHLGSELISSDGVAIYELIKNSIDAKSREPIEIVFDIVIKQADFATCINLVKNDRNKSLTELKQAFKSEINVEANETLKTSFLNAIETAQTRQDLLSQAIEAYKTTSRIIFKDTGFGMTARELTEIYLTIGTTHRAKKVRAAIARGDEKPPYLGEKGVGRLSVMRLGWRVRVETATDDDTNQNVLEIDWRKFEEADDADASTIKLKPVIGSKKPVAPKTSATTITVTDLRSSWDIGRLEIVARDDIARMADPFSTDVRRFRLKMSLNGVNVTSPRHIVGELLKSAHATCIGKYFFDPENRKPTLEATIETPLYEGSPKVIKLDLTDLLSLSGLKDNGQPSSVLNTLGEFEFELYWFNRQKLKAIPDIGARKDVSALVKAWTGIGLYRDGYRVLPYGGEGDDWLRLDMEALSASGYKLNTKQLIGRIKIGRTKNPALLDQTNRQGLVETPERDALISMMHELISRWWHDYLNDAIQSQKKQKELGYDAVAESTVVETLEKRATSSIREIRHNYTGEGRLLTEVKEAFLEIKDAHQRAVERIGAIEEEKERLTQLAGVGLLVEMIAHELTRATELTQATLKDLSRKQIGADASAALKTLGAQIKVIQKRLVALEPLSISARFRRSRQNLHPIVNYIFEGHISQFGEERHNISHEIKSTSREVYGFIIEGHFVQILENLIINSVYWMDVYKKEHPSFEPHIAVELLVDPPRIRYSDNGPGIPKNRVDIVFDPFFSTKKGTGTRRQGLGLYIARQNAESMGGSLSLVDLGSIQPHRYNTFELELKEDANGA